MALNKGSVGSSGLYLENGERDLDSKEGLLLGKTEAGREKIRHDQLEEVEKTPREGHTVDLHPRKTLRNVPPAPPPEQGSKRDTEGRGGRAEMRVCGRVIENGRKFGTQAVRKAFLAAGKNCISIEIPTFQTDSQKVKTCLSISP